MNYTEFVEKLMKMITEETGYKAMFFEATPKQTEDKILICAGECGSHSFIMGISAKECYFAWEEGKTTMEEIVQGLKDSDAIFDKKEVEDTLKNMEDYEKIKNFLFIRPLNYNNHQAELEDCLYRRIGEIALVLYVKIFDEDNMMTSFKLPVEYAKRWNMEEQNVFQKVMENTAHMMPPRVYSLLDMIINPNCDGTDIYDPNFKPSKSEMGNCFSTTVKTNGAAAIFYPGAARRMSDLMGQQDLYLVFTSIHEVMVHYAPVVEPKNLEFVLKDTIENATPEGDMLTRHIYHYSREDNEIRMLPLSSEE